METTAAVSGAAGSVRAHLRWLLAARGEPCVVTMGTFDGVHAGHRVLVGRAAEAARDRGLPLVAVTFTPRPEVVVSSRRALPDICSIEERVERLRDAGADDVVVVPFTRELMALSAAEFAEHLGRDLGMRVLVVGTDFAFGRGRAGTVDALRELGLEVIDVPTEAKAGMRQKISSSTIRRAIDAGVCADLALTLTPPVRGDLEPLDHIREIGPLLERAGLRQAQASQEA
jgi:riboflavin kinase/FMN adenylyltransferase